MWGVSALCVLWLSMSAPPGSHPPGACGTPGPLWWPSDSPDAPLGALLLLLRTAMTLLWTSLKSAQQSCLAGWGMGSGKVTVVCSENLKEQKCKISSTYLTWQLCNKSTHHSPWPSCQPGQGTPQPSLPTSLLFTHSAPPVEHTFEVLEVQSYQGTWASLGTYFSWWMKIQPHPSWFAIN